MSEPFTIERDGAVATLTFDRADRRNSFQWPFWQSFRQSVEALDADGCCRALIIAANGAHFSAGMDYGFFDCATCPEGLDEGRYREGLLNVIHHLQAAVGVLEQVRFPVIAVTQGACIGGALDLICAATLRICSGDAFFQAAEVDVGLAPDMGTMQRLPKLISPAIATELILTGRPFHAAEAQQIGFVAAVEADADAARNKAMAIAQQIAGKSPLAVAGIKAGLLFARDNPVRSGLSHVAAWNAGMFVTDDIGRSVAARRARSDAEYDDLQPVPPDWLFG